MSYAPRGWPARVRRFPSLPSTQDEAKRLAGDGAPEWTVVVAGRQTRGRGRLGRRWRSGPGGLYLSVILRPRLAPADLGRLSLECGSMAARVVARVSGLRTRVKPPNDVLALDGDRWLKVCGILIEASGGQDNVDWVVIGIGVNVTNRVPRALKTAASLASLGGRSPALGALSRALLASLRRQMTQWP